MPLGTSEAGAARYLCLPLDITQEAKVHTITATTRFKRLSA